jgi:hypothetical protein
VESVGGNQFLLEIKKEDLDKACKDKSHKTYKVLKLIFNSNRIFKENFKVVATFSGMEPNTKIAPLNPERKQSSSYLLILFNYLFKLNPKETWMEFLME